MRRITTSTLSNQSLVTALLCHTYTADADRLLYIRLFADQVAGNGAYSAYVTIQRAGAGSAYEVQPRTSPTVASGITAIAFTTIAIPVLNTDVVKVYLLGLAGDTTTPDIVTEIWEDDSLRPTTAGQHNVDVTSGGEVGLDWANIGSPTTAQNLSGTTVGLIDGAITAAKIEAAAITNAKFAAGAINATVAPNLDVAVSSRGTADPGDAMDLITDAVDASALAASAVAEISAGIDLDCSEITVTLAQTPTQISDLINRNEHLTIYTDSKFTARLYVTGGISADRDDFLLTLKTRQKRDNAAPDSESLIQWGEDGGLLYINEKTAADAGTASSDGTMTISNETVGDVTTGIIDLTLTAQAAALLRRHTDLVWDGKEIHTNSDNSAVKIEGTGQIIQSVTRTIA